jgi:hypothetical protein
MNAVLHSCEGRRGSAAESLSFVSSYRTPSTYPPPRKVPLNWSTVILPATMSSMSEPLV